jgi:serine phosphatase RsbU (regulator of sigma subunit)
MRTLVALDARPDTLMTRVDDVHHHLGLSRLVTAIYAVVDVATGTVDVVNAGHPRAVLVRADGSVEDVEHASAVLIGVGGGPRDVVRVELGAGDKMLLYSDGLTERRGESLDVGLDRLHEACRASGAEPPDAFAEQVVAALRDEERDDDVVVLVLGRDPHPSA